MEILFIVVIFIGFGLVQAEKTEKRIADIIEEDDQVIALFTYLLTMAYHEIPNTVKNEELKEQIELVLDGVEDSNED